MTAAVPVQNLSVLETTLLEVRAVLQDMVAAADEQYAAFEASDLLWLERVSRQQDRLTARLERAERERLKASSGVPIRDLPAQLSQPQAAALSELIDSIAETILELHARHARNAALLQGAAELAGQTVQFLQKLVAERVQPYGANGAPVITQSLLVDGHA